MRRMMCPTDVLAQTNADHGLWRGHCLAISCCRDLQTFKQHMLPGMCTTDIPSPHLALRWLSTAAAVGALQAVRPARACQPAQRIPPFLRQGPAAERTVQKQDLTSCYPVLTQKCSVLNTQGSTAIGLDTPVLIAPSCHVPLAQQRLKEGPPSPPNNARDSCIRLLACQGSLQRPREALLRQLLCIITACIQQITHSAAASSLWLRWSITCFAS
jgi:hypothetical protein